MTSLLKTKSLVMIFSDFLVDETETLDALYRLRHSGHDVILFHVLDEAEVNFPFKGVFKMRDPETDQELKIDAAAHRKSYVEQITNFRDGLGQKLQSRRD